MAGAVLLVVLGFSVPAASSTHQALRGTKEFHATKDCSGFTGLVGAYCTIRSSNVEALKVGPKIFYVQVAGKTALDSDTVVYVRRGSVATGHCFLRHATGVGLCTISELAESRHRRLIRGKDGEVRRSLGFAPVRRLVEPVVEAAALELGTAMVCAPAVVAGPSSRSRQ